MEEGENGSKKKSVFTTELSKVPCFRQSFLYSISIGLGGGLTYFLFTSKTLKSFHVSFLTYAVSWVGMFSYCMANRHLEKVKINNFKEWFKQSRTGTQIESESGSRPS